MKIKIVILLAAVFIFAPAFSDGATIFTDDFNSYNNGNLASQGGWINEISNDFSVQSSVVFEGTKAIRSNTIGYYPSSRVKRKGALTSDGTLTFYVRVNANGSGWVDLRESSTNKVGATIQYGGPASLLGGKIKYWAGFKSVDLGEMLADTWYAVQIQWRSSDKKTRYNINGGEWTQFVLADAWSFGLDTVILEANIGGGQTTYFDTIQESLVGVESRTPVLIVPGLLGTEMKKGEELLWPDVTRMIVTPGDNFMDPLQFNDNLSAVDNNIRTKDLVGEPFPGEHFYDLLINEFKNQNYTQNETLFTFPYDWRYGVSGAMANGKTNVDLLKEKIDEILQETGAEKVDVVAHSMGGLIVKKYAMENPTGNNIGKAVFVGVPNTGAPKSAKVLLQGDNFGVIGLNDEEMKKIAKNMPAGYDLLPSQEYYDDNGSFIKTINVDAGELAYEEKDLNYQESKSFLTSSHNLNSQGMSRAENLHAEDFDNFDLRTAGVNLYSINGCKTGTINKIVETKKTNIFNYTTTTYDIQSETSGDGTVPLESANNLLVYDSNLFYALKPDHGKMPSQDGIRQKIVNLIAGSSLNVGSKIISKADLDQSPEKCELTGFLISKHSPISIEAQDQNGNRSGIAPDGSIQNNIPGADYEIMGEQAFIFIPTDENQDYTINLKGEGNGTFTLKNSQIINGQTAKTEVFSNLPVTADLVGQINLSGSATALLLDTNNDGATDQIAQPSSVIDENQSYDLLPPVSSADLSGAVGQPGFYRSDVSVNLSAIDDSSGVLSINYNLDNAGYQKIDGSTVIFAVSSEESHSITFFATDKAGNNEPEKTITFTIDKTPPEAIIEFDPNIKDLKFTSNETATIEDNDNIILMTDQAGNTTEITLKSKNRKILMRAEIKTIKYNGASADISKNVMAFLWIYDKKNNLAKLSQHAQTKKGYNILAVYNGERTAFLGRDANGLIVKSFNGLKIIKITTNKGDLSWSY